MAYAAVYSLTHSWVSPKLAGTIFGFSFMLTVLAGLPAVMRMLNG